MSDVLARVSELYRYVRDGKQPRITLEYDADATEVIGQAYTRLIQLEQDVKVLRQALSVYAPESFYEELPPSKALEDRGQTARVALSKTDPAGVVE